MPSTSKGTADGFVLAVAGGAFNNAYLGAILGLFFFLIQFEVRIINPGCIDWLMSHDSATHFLGWHFFRNEPWGFPLGSISSYLYPEGTSLVYTDSLPLLALPLKLLSSVLPPLFQYKGLWLLASYILHGAFAAALLSRFTQARSLIVLGVLFFLLSPVLLARTLDHEALAGQWVILASLCLYTSDFDFTCKLKWVALATVCLLVHFYLYVMVLIILAGYLVKILLLGAPSSPRGRNIIFFLLVLLSMSIATMHSVGYFVIPAGDAMAKGYGYYSMNLLSPVTPSPSVSFFSSPTNLYTEGQIGVNYLGVGVISLFFISGFFFCVNNKERIFAQCLPIILIISCSTLLALSNKITLGDKLLLDIALPNKIEAVLSVVRASDRLFWPAYYMIMLAAIAGVIRYASSRIAFLVLGGCLIVQIIDVQPLYREFVPGRAQWQSPLKSAGWIELMKKVEHIVFVPAAREGEKYMPFALLAASNKKTINVGYVARLDPKRRGVYYSELLEDMREGRLRNDSLYVMSGGAMFEPPAALSSTIMYGSLDGYQIIAPKIEGVTLVSWPFHVPARQKHLHVSELCELLSQKDRLILLRYHKQQGNELPAILQKAISGLSNEVNMTFEKKSFACVISEGRLEAVSSDGIENFQYLNHIVKVDGFGDDLNDKKGAIYIDGIPFYPKKKHFNVVMFSPLNKEVRQYIYDDLSEGVADPVSLDITEARSF